MAPTWLHIVSRDGAAASTSAQLDTGAIIGISCGAGGLFLGAMGLFVVYWRRQRRFETAEPYYPRIFEERPATGATPIYTLDYKHDSETATNAGSSLTYSPDMSVPGPNSFSPLGEMVSAMPTHPAYIPRAIVRGSTPASTPPNSTPRSQFSLSPPPPQRSRKSRPDDLVMQAFLRAADGERVPSSFFQQPAGPTEDERGVRDSEGEISTSSSQPRRHSSARRQQMTHAAAPFPATSAASRPRNYSPPQLNVVTTANLDAHNRAMHGGSRPMEITAPLESSPQQPQPQQFQQLQFHQQPPIYEEQHYSVVGQMTNVPDRRTFRDRSRSVDHRRNLRDRSRSIGRSMPGGGSGSGPSHHHMRSASGTRGGDIQTDQDVSFNNRQYQEVEIAKDADIW